MLGELESLIFPGGLLGSNILLPIVVLLVFALLLFTMRVPIYAILIILAPAVLIGGGSLISSFIPGWIKLIVVIGLFMLVGLAYVSFTSANK